MKCIICGKELVGHQRKYCSMECAQIGYYTGKAERPKDESKEVSKLFKKYLKEYNLESYFHGYGRGKYIRRFIAACVEKGFNVSSIAKGINRCHTTVSKHVRKLTNEDKLVGHQFLLGNYEKESIYPKGFSYGVKQ